MNNHLGHAELLRHYQSEVYDTFTEVGGIAPPVSELYDTQRWHYCQTIDKKARGKIGYRCEFGYAGNRPFIKIVVNSFRHGGEQASFNSLYHKVDSAFTVKRTIPRAQLEARRQQHEAQDAADTERRHKDFVTYLNQWRHGSKDAYSHPYVVKKNILHAEPLRQVGNTVTYPITNIDGEITAVQLIFANGEKRIYGKKKGGFCALGDIKKAKTLYFCEGYSTANAVYELAYQSGRPIAVIACIDAGNLPVVVRHFKAKYPHQRFVICPDNDKKTFDKGRGNPGLMAGFDAAMATFATIKIPSTDFGSDWCDEWVASNDATDHFQEKTRYSLQAMALERLCQFPAKPNTLSLKRAIYQAFKLMVADYPVKHTEADIIEKVLTAVIHTKSDATDVAHIWRRVKKRRFAMALRAKTFSLKSQAGIEVIRCTSIDEMLAKVTTLKKSHPRAVFATNAPMGTGKTQHLMRPEYAVAESRAMLPLVITPVRSLTKGVSTRFDAYHYLEDEAALANSDDMPANLAITINSIINPKYQEFLSYTRALFVDEYTQVLRAITMGTVDNAMRQATENKLADLIEKAHYTYIADADLHQIAINHLREITPDAVPLFIFTLSEQERATPIHYRCHRYDAARLGAYGLNEEMLTAIKDGEKVYIATDSKAHIQKLQVLLKDLNLSVLTITSDTIHFDGPQAFLKAPDAYLSSQQPDVVIVSPAVQSGVSIESSYFDRAFGVYTGTITPVIFQQMLHRLRAQTDFDLVLPESKGAGLHPLTNPTTLLMAAYQQHVQQFGDKTAHFDAKTGVTHIGRLQVMEEKGVVSIKGDEWMRRFESLSANLIALENQQRQFAGQFLILQAWTRGVQVEWVDHHLSDLEKIVLKKNKQTLTDTIQTIRQSAIKGEDTLSDEDYRALQQQGAKTQTDVVNMARHEVANAFRLTSVDTDDVVFYDDGGVNAVSNLHLLKQGVGHANGLDEKDKRAGVAKTGAQWRRAKVRLLQAVIAHLEIDIATGEGIWNNSHARPLRELISGDEELARFVLFRLKLKTMSALSDVAFANKLVKKLLGLTINRYMVREGNTRTWCYFIEGASFKTLMHYYSCAYVSGYGQAA